VVKTGLLVNIKRVIIAFLHQKIHHLLSQPNLNHAFLYPP